MRDRGRLRGLYAVTPELPDTERLAALVRDCIAGGAALVQYRAKRASGALALVQARALADVCRAGGVPLIVNDSVALALAVGADGINETQIYAARQLTAVLRSKYQILDANCVTHGLVSVNPSNRLMGYHTDWVAGFPFTALGLAEAALDRGTDLYLYLIDDGVRALDDPRIRALPRRGAKLFACAYGCQKRRIPLEDAETVTYCGLVVLTDLINGTDRFVRFAYTRSMEDLEQAARRLARFAASAS